MAEYLTNDTELKSVANAIRTKTGGSTNLIYPSGFASAIQGIAADCNATASEIMSGKTAYVGNSKITGTMSSKAATTYNVSSSNQTISAGQYLSGAQTIRGVTTSNIAAGNIKAGVTVQVGDAGSAGRIASVAGTFTSDGTAAASDILSGKIAYVNGSKITGSISGKAAATYNTSTSDQTISAGQYLSGAQTIRKVTTSNIAAANIKTGVTVQVGDAGSAGRIANVAGTFTSDANAAAGDILSGKTAYVNGSKITGSIASKAATTYNASTSAQTIAAGQYLSGAQTIRAITTANISAANIKKGVTIQVGDSGSATRIASVTGTCPACVIPSGIVPIMLGVNTSWTGWSLHSESSSYESQSTSGYIYRADMTPSDNKAVMVPSRMTWTIYDGRHTHNLSTITLEANTWYWFRGTSSTGSNGLAIYSDSSGLNLFSYFYKLVSWTYA